VPTDLPVLCRLGITLWNDPSICRVASWPSTLGFVGFATAARQIFPEFNKRAVSFFLLPGGALWEDGRERIASDEDLCRAANSIASSYRTSPLSGGHPTLYLHDDGASPTTSPGHDKFNTSPIPSVCSGSSGSRSRQQQSIMRNRVLLHDHSRCVVCGFCNVAYLECAHIVDDSVNKRKDESAILKAAGLQSTFDVINGVTLCKECHVGFGHQAFCFDAHTGSVMLGVAAKIKSRDGPWRAAVGKRVQCCDPSNINYWPPQSLFEFQQQRFYDENNKLSPGTFPSGLNAAILALSRPTSELSQDQAHIVAPAAFSEPVFKHLQPPVCSAVPKIDTRSSTADACYPEAATTSIEQAHFAPRTATSFYLSEVMTATCRSESMRRPVLEASLRKSVAVCEDRASLYMSQCASITRLTTTVISASRGQASTRLSASGLGGAPSPNAQSSWCAHASKFSSLTLPDLRQSVNNVASETAARPARGPYPGLRSKRSQTDAALYAGKSALHN
jgi:hypothetical protein